MSPYPTQCSAWFHSDGNSQGCMMLLQVCIMRTWRFQQGCTGPPLPPATPSPHHGHTLCLTAGSKQQVQPCLDSTAMAACVCCQGGHYSRNAVPGQSLTTLHATPHVYSSPNTHIMHKFGRSTHPVRACWQLPWVRKGPFWEGTMLG